MRVLAGGEATEEEHDGLAGIQVRGRAEMVTSRSPVGSLATSLFSAERAYLTAEHVLEQLLDSLFDSWSDYEVGNFVIDVYDAIDSEAARDALSRAGFVASYAHEHSKAKFRTCSCRSEARQ